MNCKHCEAPNTEGWFYCKTCGERASSRKFTNVMFMRSETGKRTDIEFRTTSLEEDVKQVTRRQHA